MPSPPPAPPRPNPTWEKKKKKGILLGKYNATTMCCFPLHGKCFHFLPGLIPDRKVLLHPRTSHTICSTQPTSHGKFPFPSHFPGFYLNIWGAKTSNSNIPSRSMDFSFCVSFPQLHIHENRISWSWKTKEKGNFVENLFQIGQVLVLTLTHLRVKEENHKILDCGQLGKGFSLKRYGLMDPLDQQRGWNFLCLKRKTLPDPNSNYFGGRFHQDPWKFSHGNRVADGN